ncbi:MAG TPA: response regulator transcription factor [Thermoanaerobaculia bacterium]|jgi:DNA-binding NarL/FixJ family response regulator
MALATVVLIEDNPVFLRLLTTFFERAEPQRFRIAGTARSGETGVEVVEQLQPDGVVVDLKLPGMSGLDVISRLRSRDARVALVALTSAEPDAFRDPVVEAGADGFVTKDRLTTDLLPALRRAVRARTNPVISEDHVDG